MKQSTLLKVASQSILKNKMRTLLTMLGIVIGVGAVIVMVAVGNGAQTMIKRQISSLGTNLIIVMPGSGVMGGANQGAGTFNRLTLADAEKAHIARILEKTGGNVTRAAEMLQIDRVTLYNKIKKYQLRG
jgi:DNA-binding NtrC family response regulator